MKRYGRLQMLSIALFSAIALAAPLALAQTAGSTVPNSEQKGPRPEWRGRGGKRHGGGMFGLHGLNLTEDQQARIKQIRESFRERTQPLRQELRAKHEDLRQANDGASFNEALATQKLTEMAALQAKMMGEEFRQRQEVLAVLTPEQRTQLNERREQMKSRRAERRGAQIQ